MNGLQSKTSANRRLAKKKFKTTGTIHFLSRVSATPELNNINETETAEK